MPTETQAKIKSWGNSFGIIIPKDVIAKEGLRVHDTVHIRIAKKRSLAEFFGKGTGKITDPQKVKDEARAQWKMD